MNGPSFTFHCEAKQGLDDIFLAAILTCQQYICSDDFQLSS